MRSPDPRIGLLAFFLVPFLLTPLAPAQEKAYRTVPQGRFDYLGSITTNVVQVLPRPVIFLTAFRWEVEKKEGTVTIVNPDQIPLEISGIKTEGDRFTPRLTTIEEGQRYQLSIKLNPDAPPGKAQGQITVSTNKEEIKIPVFTFLKDRVYMSESIVDFGEISLKQLSAHPDLKNFLPYIVFIYQHNGQDFQINYQSSLPFMSVKRTPEKGPGAVINIPRQGKTAVFELAITPIVERLKPGRFEGRIRVTTNDKDFPELVIPVQGDVVEN